MIGNTAAVYVTALIAALLDPGLGLAGGVEQVAVSRWQWTGIAVTNDHRIIVSYPRWSDRMGHSVAVLDAYGCPQPFPDAAWNDWEPDAPVHDRKFVAVQSVVLDARQSLWVLDTGNPFFGGVLDGAARLFKFDAGNGQLLRSYPFAPPAIEPTSYLNDVRIDLEHGVAYLTDSGAGGLMIVDLETGSLRRVLEEHEATRSEDIDVVIEGQPWRQAGVRPQVHADGLAYDAMRDLVYFQALTGQTMYSVPGAALRDSAMDDDRLAAAVRTASEHFPVDGLLADRRGRIYLSNLQAGAVDRFDPARPNEPLERMTASPLVAWPDSFASTSDGWLYFTTAQIHRADNPAQPYRVFRLWIGN